MISILVLSRHTLHREIARREFDESDARLDGFVSADMNAVMVTFSIGNIICTPNSFWINQTPTRAQDRLGLKWDDYDFLFGHGD